MDAIVEAIPREAERYNVKVLTQHLENHAVLEVSPPVSPLRLGLDYRSYPHISHRTSWKEGMTRPAEMFAGILAAHGVEGYQFPWCPLCPNSGWGYAKHLPAEMHYKKLYGLVEKYGSEPFMEVRERFWQEVRVVGGRVRFNHADGALQVQRIDEPRLYRYADFSTEPEGTWFRICERLSVPIGPRCTRDEYPLLMLGRQWWKSRMKVSWNVLERLLSSYCIFASAQCHVCANPHDMCEERLGGKSHFDTLWVKVSNCEGPIPFDDFWQIWHVVRDGFPEEIRYNHLDGAIELRRSPNGSFASAQPSWRASASTSDAAPSACMCHGALAAGARLLGPQTTSSQPQPFGLAEPQPVMAQSTQPRYMEPQPMMEQPPPPPPPPPLRLADSQPMTAQPPPPPLVETHPSMVLPPSQLPPRLAETQQAIIQPSPLRLAEPQPRMAQPPIPPATSEYADSISSGICSTRRTEDVGEARMYAASGSSRAARASAQVNTSDHGGQSLLHFLWCRTLRDHAQAFSASLSPHMPDVRRQSCLICDRPMVEGFCDHVLSPGHLREVQETLSSDIVPPSAHGEGSRWTQRFGPAWFNHLTGEWGSSSRWQAVVDHDANPGSGYLSFRQGAIVRCLHGEDAWFYGSTLGHGGVVLASGWFLASSVEPL
eukprot:TRINITY_DN8268_c0_g1_i1.p1 TRINITY_DN8268_c0_g1~~TRINITY_DN8268_c0_g1_i1.p1  ORF type:complete len:656 (-),score=84.34 TRINITY_DN8268_c0_g1_i1:106-2073(-)